MNTSYGHINTSNQPCLVGCFWRIVKEISTRPKTTILWDRVSIITKWGSHPWSPATGEQSTIWSPLYTSSPCRQYINHLRSKLWFTDTWIVTSHSMRVEHSSLHSECHLLFLPFFDFHVGLRISMTFLNHAVWHPEGSHYLVTAAPSSHGLRICGPRWRPPKPQWCSWIPSWGTKRSRSWTGHWFDEISLFMIFAYSTHKSWWQRNGLWLLMILEILIQNWLWLRHLVLNTQNHLFGLIDSRWSINCLLMVIQILKYCFFLFFPCVQWFDSFSMDRVDIEIDDGLFDFCFSFSFVWHSNTYLLNCIVVSLYSCATTEHWLLFFDDKKYCSLSGVRFNPAVVWFSLID